MATTEPEVRHGKCPVDRCVEGDGDDHRRRAVRAILLPRRRTALTRNAARPRNSASTNKATAVPTPPISEWIFLTVPAPLTGSAVTSGIFCTTLFRYVTVIVPTR